MGKIMTKGISCTTIEPDSMKVCFCIGAHEETVNCTIEKGQKTTELLLEKLREMGVEISAIEADAYQVREKRNYKDDSTQFGVGNGY